MTIHGIDKMLLKLESVLAECFYYQCNTKDGEQRGEMLNVCRNIRQAIEELKEQKNRERGMQQ